MPEDKKKSQEETTPVDSKKKESKSEDKTFTQNELNEMIGKTRQEVREQVAKEVSEKLSKEFTEKLQKKEEEAQRLAKLSAEEREKEITERDKKEVEERERKIAIRENTLDVKSKFIDKGYDADLAEIIVTEDKDKSLANADLILENIDKQVEKGINERLKDTPPKSVKSKKDDGSSKMKDYY
jgi:hypothetical protein